MKKQIESERLRLMISKSAIDLGKKVDKHLLDMYGLDENEYTFIVPIKESFFSDGHLKVEISDTVRGKEVFCLTDVGNCSVTYKMRGYINHTSPNDWLMQLKDMIGACSCHTKAINVVMPYLYAGRQHRKNTRENLACGQMLHEIDVMRGMKSFITFDAHDQSVEHAVHDMEFGNIFATNVMLEKFIKNTDIEELKQLLFIAPDNGAVGRRNVYLNSFDSQSIKRSSGSFIKVRDYNNLVDGKYPIKEHRYSGDEGIEGYTAIITDDMISSGNSMFDVIDQLKKKNVKHIYLFTTFSLFTEGIEKFDEYYKEGKFDGLYTTNLTHIPEEYQERRWLQVCDCSKLIAEVIYNIHNNLSLTQIKQDKSQPVKLLEKKLEITK